jgi:alpha-glucosidase
MDVRFAGLGSIAKGATYGEAWGEMADETDDLPWGKTKRIRNHYRAMTVRLKAKSGVEWNIEFRAYDDGVAWRYGFPVQKQLRDFVIEDENSEFWLGGDPTVMFTVCDGYTTSHEALYEKKRLSELTAGKLLDKPLLAVWPDGTAAAITEAGLRDFAGMYLEVEKADRPNFAVSRGRGFGPSGANVDQPIVSLRTRMSPLPEKKNALVTGKTPHWSPWRVVMLADEAGELIESNMLLCLNDPPDGDFSWVKPGKTTFHWWNGTVENGPPSTPETNFEIHKKYIDFCARNKISYHSVISVSGNRPWFVQSTSGFGDLPHADTDILTPRPDIDLPRILAYAKEKGVGIRFWVHWKPLSEKLDEAFAQYERWGIRGLMVDFMDRDDQEMVEWQEKCLRAAAKHKLHIQFHGSYKPTGEERSYPNLFNREGVLNLEYSKWSDLVTPQHSVDVAYTRMLAGPVDYHLGGFRAAPREEFQPRDLRPVVMGTRANQLALYVVYDNPMPMVADEPSAYEGEPGFDFIVDVPTTWDETRFVAGEPGEYIVVARRSGATWYLGGITNWTQRKLKLPLAFLGDGSYEARLYLDDSPDGKEPNKIREETRLVKSDKRLDVSLAAGGGVAAVIRPK